MKEIKKKYIIQDSAIKEILGNTINNHKGQNGHVADFVPYHIKRKKNQTYKIVSNRV